MGLQWPPAPPRWPRYHCKVRAMLPPPSVYWSDDPIDFSITGGWGPDPLSSAWRLPLPPPKINMPSFSLAQNVWLVQLAHVFFLCALYSTLCLFMWVQLWNLLPDLVLAFLCPLGIAVLYLFFQFTSQGSKNRNSRGSRRTEPWSLRRSVADMLPSFCQSGAEVLPHCLPSVPTLPAAPSVSPTTQEVK